LIQWLGLSRQALFIAHGGPATLSGNAALGAKRPKEFFSAEGGSAFGGK
jgi:hypothetical protein